jgi:hypothetical protein
MCRMVGVFCSRTSIGITAEVARPCDERLVLVGAGSDGVYADS